MKKILIGVLIVLLIIMAWTAIFNGISIGGFQILSVQQIADENEKLTQQIQQTEMLMKSSYPTETEKLDSSISELLEARDEYHTLASVSTDNEIKQANQDEEYTVEFLLASLGRHARKEGVNLEYTISSGTVGQNDIKNINFNITGSYTAVINFVAAVEDDGTLGFRIRNFKLVPGGQYLNASFLVTNVKIKQETVSSGGSTTPATNNSNTQNSTTNTNTTGNTNNNTTSNTTSNTVTNNTQNTATNNT